MVKENLLLVHPAKLKNNQQTQLYYQNLPSKQANLARFLDLMQQKEAYYSVY
jgi:hypothetical protein